MPSSKGKPTDPKLREKVKEDVKNETNRDGGGKGQWSAWKAAKLSKEYEKKGGGYENDPGSKNEPKARTPQHKSEQKKGREMKASEKEKNEAGADREKSDKENLKPEVQKGTKANQGKKKQAPKKKTPTEGMRRSSRVAGKRKAAGEVVDGQGKTKKSKK